MARTLGQVAEILLKTPTCASYDLLLLTERINGRYQEILNAHPWSRLAGSGTISTVDDYSTGTLAITTGLTAVTLTSGSFPTALDGGRLRVGGDATTYVFTRLTASTGTLDRAYEADSVTEAAYQLWQPVYALPSDTDILESIAVPSQGLELDEISPEELDEIDAARLVTGPPRTYARYKDTAAGLQRVELWPGPTAAEGLPVRYRSGGTMFMAIVDAAVAFPDWIDTDAVIAGVEADIAAERGNGALAQLREARFAAKVAAMFAEDCQRRSPVHLDMTDRYTVHRVLRELDMDRVDRRATLINSFR